MKQCTAIACSVILLLLPSLIVAKPSGEYSTIPDYGTTGFVSGASYQAYQDSPALITSALKPTYDLKSAGSFDIGYGAPVHEPIVPIIPFGKLGGWGWKQPQPLITPIPIIAKPIHFPIATTIPFGWGWQNPGLF